MKKFFDTENVVKKILVDIPITRNNDWFLFITYWKLKAPEGVNFQDYFNTPWRYGAPSYKHIERCRRKLQSKFPELRDNETAEARFEESMKYENYAING